LSYLVLERGCGTLAFWVVMLFGVLPSFHALIRRRDSGSAALIGSLGLQSFVFLVAASAMLIPWLSLGEPTSMGPYHEHLGASMTSALMLVVAVLVGAFLAVGIGARRGRGNPGDGSLGLVGSVGEPPTVR
jgi:hypothetical protein